MKAYVSQSDTGPAPKESAPRGKLIVIEGIDGSGKKTQTDLLIKRLKKIGKKVLFLDFPQYYTSFFGNLVSRYLKGEFGDIYQVNPYLISVIYAADRWEAKEKIHRALAKGEIVILNRYSISNMAHQAVKIASSEREDYLDWERQMEYDIFEIPREDLVIYLDVPAGIGQKLIGRKQARGYVGGKKKDIHEKDLRYQHEVRKQYLGLSRYNPHWRVINCIKNGKMLPVEIIQEKIWQVVRICIK